MYNSVLKFWFTELKPQDWYKKNIELDQRISKNYSNVYAKAIKSELYSWRSSIEGRLAEIIVLDQFSRNMFRGKAESFQYDTLALSLSQEASISKEAKLLTPEKKAFLYMPFMHSESLVIHSEAIKLFSEAGLEKSLQFEIKHKEIIEKFGRYPHRNKILGRESTPEEVEFLELPGSSF